MLLAGFAKRDEGTHLVQGPGTDAADLSQVLDAIERAVFIAMVDYSLSEGRSDPGEKIKLAQRRDVDIDESDSTGL